MFAVYNEYSDRGDYYNPPEGDESTTYYPQPKLTKLQIRAAKRLIKHPMHYRQWFDITNKNTERALRHKGMLDTSCDYYKLSILGLYVLGQPYKEVELQFRF